MLLAFPLVGLVVGGLWAGTAWLAGLGLPPVAVAALVVGVDVAVTGALHLDAVGDVGDGYAARRSGADPLVAMTDSRLGAVGAATLVAVLVVRVGLLTVLVADPWTAGLWLVPVIGRAGMGVALWAAPSRGGSVAGALASAASTPVIAVIVAATGLLAFAAVAAGAAAAHTAVAIAVGLLLAVLVIRRGVAAFGQPGGDLIGTAGMAAETFALLALAWRG